MKMLKAEQKGHLKIRIEIQQSQEFKKVLVNNMVSKNYCERSEERRVGKECPV